VNVRFNPRRRSFALAASVAAAIPAAAFADSIGAHSSFYSTVSPKTRHYVPNSANIDLHRATGVALVNVSNKCLGTFTVPSPGPGMPGFTGSKNASITARLRKGRLSFRGHAKLIAGQSSAGRVRMIFNAMITPRKATGTATFPGTKCHKIKFVAPLRERTK